MTLGPPVDPVASTGTQPSAADLIATGFSGHGFGVGPAARRQIKVSVQQRLRAGPEDVNVRRCRRDWRAGHVQHNNARGDDGNETIFSANGRAGLAASVTVWSGALTAAEIPKSPEVQQTGTFTIANTLDYAPFEYLDADGKQTGIIVELAGEVAKLLDAKLDIQRTPFPSMIPGLAAGRFKIAWETFSANPERLKQVDFVMFVKAGVAASTTPEKQASFTGDSPLCGKRIGVSAGNCIRLPGGQAQRRMCREKVAGNREVGVQFVDGYRAGGAVRPCRCPHG